MFDKPRLQHPLLPAPLLIAALELLYRRWPHNELNTTRLPQRAVLER